MCVLLLYPQHDVPQGGRLPSSIRAMSRVENQSGELNDCSAISAISTCYHWSFRYILIHCLSNSNLQFHIEHHLHDLNVSVSIWTDLSCVVLMVYLLPLMRMNLCALCITRQKCYVCRAPESNHAMRPPF